MVQVNPQLSTGLPGLDHVLRGLIPGDNVVWQMESPDQYREFVHAFCLKAASTGRPIIYFRFAKSTALPDPVPGVLTETLDPAAGFEAFVARVHQRIEQSGRGACYVFDCLSELADAWHSDTMLANFFKLTCPYLYDIEAIAYFSLLRNAHAPESIQRILDTCQVFIDVYQRDHNTYVHPVKVQHRHSPTMYMLHVRDDGQFHPVTESATTSAILSATFPAHAEQDRFRGIWRKTLREAEESLRLQRQGALAPDEARRVLRDLIFMCITRDLRVAELCEKYFDIEDILVIARRIVGTGLVGGKSLGMLLAQKILRRSGPEWSHILETHDSFYIGSDVFYTFLVENGLWHGEEAWRNVEQFLEKAQLERHRILVGSFSDEMKQRFQNILDYFGQSPIIVRSSSLLEDNFENSFAGKYESVFLASQGSREQRLHDFMSAVRTIYASTMSEKALRYRAQRGNLAQAEQMALLVQRVSGGMHGDLFYPHLAGVGFSYNPYVWSREIDPAAGVLRLVFGLGTRAVNRVDDDYTRIIALNAPERRPEENLDTALRHVQRLVDVLDLHANQLVSLDFQQVAKTSPDVPVRIFASEETPGAGYLFLTFDTLIRETNYVDTMRRMLRELHTAYQCPVDVEFTTNFLPDGDYRISLVQCRPLLVQGINEIEAPREVEPDKIILKTNGALIGRSRICTVDRIIYIVPALYGQLPLSSRYAIARLIGKLAHVREPQPPQGLMLIGPGRWCTSSPELGIPVNFAEINTAHIVVEVVAMHKGLIPDVSLGTHFFSELVEAEMLYVALFPAREGSHLSPLLEQAPNRLKELAPDDAQWEPIVRVLDASALGSELILNANTLEQQAILYKK